MNKKALTETDIRTKFITPALTGPNGEKWDLMTQIREEAYFTKGRVIVRGKTVKRGVAKKADYLLFYIPNLPLGVIEAKDNNHSVGDGMQQALEYAEILDIPFAYSTNGDAFLEHDRTATDGGPVTREIPLDQFPTPDDLWARYCKAKGTSPDQQAVVVQEYYDDGTGKSPRYYQLIAINRTVYAIARGEKRILLVMATGTGKTYTAFQIIWRLWKSGAKKRILFLVDRNILADQTKTNDFKPFGKAMTKITNRTVDKAFEIYLCLYQAVTGTEEEQNIYKQFSPDFFDLVIVDECHRGSAADDAAWRKVLDYFSSATQIGLTATPKETKDVSNIEYFGEPLYTYSLRQGISDGFLAPYKVIRIGLDKDLDGWRPEDGQKDKYGQLIEDREYNVKDFDRNLILEKRTEVVAAKITEFLKGTNRFAKTIVFCENIDHAERMRQALVNANPDLAAANSKYVMRITTLIRTAFDDANNYMKNGTLMRQVINKINGIDFNATGDRHMFGDIYEKMLKDLQSAGNAGEFYTPRAVTDFIVDQIDPRIGESFLDPATGTGGFVTSLIRHLRTRAKTQADEQLIQECFTGVEKKHLPHILCLTNLLLHGIDVPSNIRHDNTLARPLRDWSPRERVDIVATNPPFGGMEEDGIEANYPAEFRTRETADLFLVLIMKILKPGGRAGLVLPDGTLFGEGVKTRIKEALLTECNLHTIVRLPNGVFAPYTSIRTNLLFFTKGTPTKEVWYYEHPYPPGAKSYNKGKPISLAEFDAEKAWWGKPDKHGHYSKREENERAWRVSIDQIKAGNFNLDLKNPHNSDEGPGDVDHLLPAYEKLLVEIAETRAALKKELQQALTR